MIINSIVSCHDWSDVFTYICKQLKFLEQKLRHKYQELLYLNYNQWLCIWHEMVWSVEGWRSSGGDCCVYQSTILEPQSWKLETFFCVGGLRQSAISEVDEVKVRWSSWSLKVVQRFLWTALKSSTTNAGLWPKNFQIVVFVFLLWSVVVFFRWSSLLSL